MNTKQLVNRLLQIVLVLFGISFLTFCLTYLSPGDPAELMLVAGGTPPSEELLAETREEMGLNDPFLVQYGNWLKGFVTGDMGTSYSSKTPVSAVLLDCLGPTLELAAASLILMLVISIPLGILAAVYQNRFPDYLVRGLSFIGVSFPGFWIGLVLLYVFGLKLNWFPIATSGTGFMKLVLPAVTLAIAMSAKYTRQVRTAVLEELRQDYVAGARARGLKESAILWREVLPNAMLPLVTLLGLSLGSLLGGTAVVEIIFSWPGLGKMAVNAIAARDYPLVQGYVIWIALIYMVINLLVDFSYGYLDPRLRELHREVKRKAVKA
ncbi:nickel ABC transporter permease [Eubacterium sp. 1001713B170207_170306_E7]|uniref:nickel ABC transporter permease n=1 Tax=Eubacterium sp. 1001713B170207_170306_E7 TaxID=2787097 RepID=UPI001896CD2C|nr:nickel ABC transporter permease [Eubacterium sp. 1001713B170207_170306_E7]